MFTNITPRPRCIYCQKPVTEDAYDHESGGYFSYGYQCMTPTPEGRFAVLSAGKVSRRYATKLRALHEVDYLRKFNPQLPPEHFTFEDLGVGTVAECH